VKCASSAERLAARERQWARQGARGWERDRRIFVEQVWGRALALPENPQTFVGRG